MNGRPFVFTFYSIVMARLDRAIHLLLHQAAKMVRPIKSGDDEEARGMILIA
jgi:hypothetical protein